MGHLDVTRYLVILQRLVDQIIIYGLMVVVKSIQNYLKKNT